MAKLVLFRNAIPCSVLRDSVIGDCTNHGVSENRNSLWLCSDEVTKQDVLDFLESEDNKSYSMDDFVFTERRTNVGGYLNIVPMKYKDTNVWNMCGGNFLYSSDSRFREFTGSRYPLSIHDRVESREEQQLYSI